MTRLLFAGDSVTDCGRKFFAPDVAANAPDVLTILIGVNDALLSPPTPHDVFELFAAACTRAAPAWWAPDGVHPSITGHALIAGAWLDAVSV